MIINIIAHLQLLPLMHSSLTLCSSSNWSKIHQTILVFRQFVLLPAQALLNKKLVINLTRSLKVRHFCFNRIARLWNRLPYIDLSLSFLTIKCNIYSILWHNFIHHFNSDSTCSFHFVCRAVIFTYLHGR